jgi:DNA polymerase III epsilon subunit-like protein
MPYSPETPLSELTFTVLDFETTGTVKGFECLPWQVGAVTVSAQNGLLLDAPHFDTLMRVPLGHPFSGRAPGRHAQLRAEIALAPTAQEVWLKLHAALSTTIPVAHNAATERNVLARLAPMTQYPYWLDTLRIVRKAYPSLKSYALDDIIPVLGLEPQLRALVPGRDPHDAYYDAVACALLLIHLLALPGWGALTLAEAVTL